MLSIHRIMYKNGVKTLTSCTYFVPAQNDVSGDATEDEFLQFSHFYTRHAAETAFVVQIENIVQVLVYKLWQWFCFAHNILPLDLLAQTLL